MASKRSPRPSLMRLTERTFETFVQKRPGLVYFSADWAGPCHVYDPIVEDIAGRCRGTMACAELDGDEAGGVLARYGVTEVPSLVLFTDAPSTLLGLQSRATVESWLVSHGVRAAQPAQAAATTTQPPSAPPRLPQWGPALVRLQAVVDRIDAITDAALPLLARDLLRGMAFGGQQSDAATALAPAYLARIREVPTLVRTCVQAMEDRASTPAVRLGLLSSLTYVAIPHNIVTDDTGSGYGYLDDWLVLQMALFQFKGWSIPGGIPPEEHARRRQLVACAIPADRAEAVNGALTSIATQQAALALAPAPMIEQFLAALIQAPVPPVWQATAPPSAPSPSPTPAHSSSSSSNDWSINGGGSVMSDKAGNVAVHFRGGGYAAVLSDGTIVTS